MTNEPTDGTPLDYKRKTVDRNVKGLLRETGERFWFVKAQELLMATQVDNEFLKYLNGPAGFTKRSLSASGFRC